MATSVQAKAREVVGDAAYESLEAGQRQALEVVILTTDQKPCQGANSEQCRTDEEYRAAWKELLSIAPHVGRPYLYARLAGSPTPSEEKRLLIQIFENDETEMLYSVGGLQFDPLGPETVLGRYIHPQTLIRFLVEYAGTHPQSRRDVASALSVAGECVLPYEFPISQGPEQAAIYRDLVLSSLRGGKCPPEKIARIVEGLSFGNVQADLLEAVVENISRWPDKAEFRENFMKAVRSVGSPAHLSQKIKEGVEAIFTSLPREPFPKNSEIPTGVVHGLDAYVWLLEGLPDVRRTDFLKEKILQRPNSALALLEIAKSIIKSPGVLQPLYRQYKVSAEYKNSSNPAEREHYAAQERLSQFYQLYGVAMRKTLQRPIE